MFDTTYVLPFYCSKSTNGQIDNVYREKKLASAILCDNVYLHQCYISGEKIVSIVINSKVTMRIIITHFSLPHNHGANWSISNIKVNYIIND
jgi:hypothetical protein